MFGEVVGRVSGVAGGRARVALLLSGWLMRCVVEWKEVSSRLMWVRVKIESVGVYIGIWTGKRSICLGPFPGLLWIWKRPMILWIVMVCGRC